MTTAAPTSVPAQARTARARSAADDPDGASEPTSSAFQAGHHRLQPLGHPRHAREPLGHEAAGPDLDEPQRPAERVQPGGDGSLEALPVLPEDGVAEASADLGLDGRDQGARRRLVRRFGRDPHVDLARVGHRPDGGVRPLCHQVRKKLSHSALAEPGDTHEPGHDRRLEPVAGPEVRENPRAQQVLHLTRHARKDGERAVALFQDEAGGRPHGVREWDGASGNERLPPIRGRQREATSPEERLDLVQKLGVELELPAGGPCHGLPGHVVLGRSQAPGRDDDLGPAEGRLQGGGHPGEVVAHRGLLEQIDAQRGQLPRDECGVGVDDLT